MPYACVEFHFRGLVGIFWWHDDIYLEIAAFVRGVRGSIDETLPMSNIVVN